MTNIMPVLQMLGLDAHAGTVEVIEKIRELQRQVNRQRERADAMEENWKTEHARVRRAENPDNWRVVWNGDRSTSDPNTTALTHGNLITLEGTGQALFHFRPCCQNLRCECTTRRNHGRCACADNDE